VVAQRRQELVEEYRLLRLARHVQSSDRSDPGLVARCLQLPVEPGLGGRQAAAVAQLLFGDAAGIGEAQDELRMWVRRVELLGVVLHLELLHLLRRIGGDREQRLRDQLADPVPDLRDRTGDGLALHFTFLPLGDDRVVGLVAGVDRRLQVLAELRLAAYLGIAMHKTLL
jgi:hypothetical protein